MNHFIAPSNFKETCCFCGHKIAPGTLTEEDQNDNFAHAECLESAKEDAHESMREGAL